MAGTDKGSKSDNGAFFNHNSSCECNACSKPRRHAAPISPSCSEKVASRPFLDQIALNRWRGRISDVGIPQGAAADGSENRNYVKNQNAQIEKEKSQQASTVFEEIRIYGDEVDAVSDGNDGMGEGIDVDSVPDGKDKRISSFWLLTWPIWVDSGDGEDHRGRFWVREVKISMVESKISKSRVNISMARPKISDFGQKSQNDQKSVQRVQIFFETNFRQKFGETFRDFF